MKDDFERINAFVELLQKLNPNSQFNIDDEETLIIRNSTPQYLILPLGYHYDSVRRLITNGRIDEFMVIWQ